MIDLPPVADLFALLASIEDPAARRKLLGVAEAAQRAQSCAADLSLATTTLEALAQVAQADAPIVTPLHLTTIQHGLVANAVILYSRATSTHSGGGERGSVSISDRLSSVELVDHDLLVTLRNRVIAHVHADEAVGDSIWHRERLIAVQQGRGWLPACVTRRMQMDDATVARLRRMIPVADRLVRETYHKRVARLTDLMNEAGIDAELFHRHQFDAVGFFGSQDQARHALTPTPGRTAYGLAD